MGQEHGRFTEKEIEMVYNHIRMYVFSPWIITEMQVNYCGEATVGTDTLIIVDTVSIGTTCIERIFDNTD